MNDKLGFQDLEKVYDLLAAAIDKAGPADESLFLCKLCLGLAHHLGDLSLIETAIEDASSNLRS